jgi:acetyltransferase-like isoleucine patch superfamily enzyme
VVIGSFSRIFSHSHDAHDYEKTTLKPTTIGDGARIASHAIVLAGQNVAPGQSVGTFPEDDG